MSALSFQELLYSAMVDGPALGNTLTATSLLPTSPKLVLPANYLDKIGKIFRLTASGRVSNIVTSPGTLTLDLRAGATIIANGGAMALNVVAKVNVPWRLDWDFTVRAVGASANVMHQGTWTSESVIGSPLPSAGGAGCLMLPNATPAVGNNFDSGAAQTIDLFGTWSTANAGNTITVHQCIIEALN